MPSILANEALRTYEHTSPITQPGPGTSWLSKPEVPTTSEILNIAGDEFVDIPGNKIDGPWSSKEDYIGTHYELLREDAVAPLRDAVADVRENPRMKDDTNLCIYENVGKASS
jgi:helicase required for RNAi-mediated heterochromatin assembly 1